jgi:hypothetical protein
VSTIIRITRPPNTSAPEDLVFEGDIATPKGCEEAKAAIQTLHDESQPAD